MIEVDYCNTIFYGMSTVYVFFSPLYALPCSAAYNWNVLTDAKSPVLGMCYSLLWLPTF